MQIVSLTSAGGDRAFTDWLHRYKPDVPLSFLVDELAFHDDNDDPEFGARACVQFICDHGGEEFVQRREDGQIRVLTGKAMHLFENARKQAFARVDIKGQI